MYDGLNVGKRNVTLNLKKPDAVALVKRLVVEWADAVAENFAPKAMKGFGLDYDTLAAIKPDLVMISACLNGQTGPHKDYPGFGGQGSALGGLQRAHRLARPRARRPVRHDHRLARAALRRRRARGRTPLPPPHRQRRVPRHLAGRVGELVAVTVAARLRGRRRDPPARRQPPPRRARRTARSRAPTRATSATAGSRSRAGPTSSGPRSRASSASTDPRSRRSRARKAREDEIEALVAAWTATRTRAEVAEQLQAAGIEAVPVEDFGDLHDDPQLALRAHFEPHTHPFLGPGLYERNGFRLVRRARAATTRPGPTLGQDNDWVLREVLGCTDAEIDAHAGIRRGRVGRSALDPGMMVSPA